jgi:hypothetical protein
MNVVIRGKEILLKNLRFEGRHHQNSAYHGVIVRGGGEIGEDPVLEVLIDDLVNNHMS